MKKTIQTGCFLLDKLLEGGLTKEEIYLVYGEAETGKTSFAIQCAVNCARSNFKVVFIDSDGNFSSERLKQIADYNLEELSQKIILFRPVFFKEQTKIITQLEKYVSERVGLVVVDTISSLYRVELNDLKKTFEMNRELNMQIAYLAQIAKMQKVAVLILSQVRSVFSKESEIVEPIGTRTLKFWADVVMQFKRVNQARLIDLILEKHPRIKDGINHRLMVNEKGVQDFSR